MVTFPSCRTPPIDMFAAKEETCTPSRNHWAESPAGCGTMLRDRRTRAFGESAGPPHGMTTGAAAAPETCARGAEICGFIEMTSEKLPSLAAAVTMLFAL